MPVRPSITAEMVALVRAREQVRAKEARVIDDPYSGRFLAAARSSWVDAEGRPLARAALVDAAFKLPWVGLSALVLARHRIMDQLVRDEAAAGARQLVVLGAGYDARAYRFPPPEGPARAFEVDHPTLSEAKRGYVRAALGEVPGHVRFVAVDFLRERLDERLLEEGFDPAARSVFVWEGVTYYLTPEAVRGTLATVRRLSAPGSALVFDAWASPPGLRGALAEASRVAGRGIGRLLDEPFLFALRAPSAALDLLREAGFDPLFLADAERLREVLRAAGRRLLHVPAYICVAAGRAPPGIH